MDYLIAFSVYGLASLFPNYKYFYSGILITNFLRFASHTIGGVIVWETTWWGSIIYNAPYMIATTIVGMIVVPILVERLHLNKEKEKQGSGMSKKEVNRYLKKQQKEAQEPINNAFAEAFSKIKL